MIHEHIHVSFLRKEDCVEKGTHCVTTEAGEAETFGGRTVQVCSECHFICT